MKNKRGFTLVELLAVIAILAILVILALPNVMNMYVRAKKNTFLTEAQNILKESTNKFIQEGVNGKKVNVVSNSKNPLNLTGEKLTYTINLNSQGKVTDYVISNENYCISSKKSYDKLTTDDVKESCSYEELNNIAGTLSKSKFQEAISPGKARTNLVSTVSFYSDGRVINSAEKYDVSEAQDGSIYLYRKEENENSSYLDITVVANGKISFPKDSSGLFENLYLSYSSTGSTCNVKSITFNGAIDTSKVTNMSNMFTQASGMDYCYSYNPDKTNSMGPLDLTDFDTSNVTDMSGMFQGLRATSVDLSSFDTSKVTNMAQMFSNYRSNALDLSSFDTSNVTNMYAMFACSTNLQTIHVNDKFTLKNVTNGSKMFYVNSKLVGGAGTIFNNNNDDKTYAHIDGGTSNPGYFTKK